MLESTTGTIVRALPKGDGLEIKMRRDDDGAAVMLEIPANRPDLVDAARAARLRGGTVDVRHTTQGRAVTIGLADIAAAA